MGAGAERRRLAQHPMFHPLPGTLAYSDALLLFGPPYVLARVAGLAPYDALAAVVALLLLVGYAGSAWLLRRVLALPPWIAALAAFLYAFASMRLIHYPHVQLFAAMFVPLLVGLAINYARSLEPGNGDPDWRSASESDSRASC